MASNKTLSAVVIGSGFGGLASAIRLQSSGVSTTLLEKRDMAGGRAYVYRDQGFTFDAGPTVITAPVALEELFALSGRKMSDYVEMMPVHPFYRLCWEDGTRFDYTNDEAELTRQIAARNPDDVDGYRQFLAYSKAVFIEGYEKLVHVPFLRWWDMVRVSPQLLRLKAYKSVYQMVAHFIKDEKLREAFSFHSLLVGGNPFDTSSIYTLIHFLERNWGVFFPKGGTGALVQALVKLFEDLGGKIVLEAEVAEINVDQNQVTGVALRDGRRFVSDMVFSNADVVHTYDKLLAKIPSAQRKARSLKKSRYSMSLFLIYFGTRKQYPAMAHHSVLFGPRYKELLDDIFYKGVVADDFSLYLHVPSRTDASLAPAGCDGMYVLSPVPHLGKSDVDWNTFGPVYADRILSYLEKHYLPDLKANLVTQRIFTPLDFSSELNAHVGSAFSLEPVLTQSAFFRVHNRDSKIRGLYFAGAGTHPGAGVPGVVNSAKASVSVALSDFSLVEKKPFTELSPSHV